MIFNKPKDGDKFLKEKDYKRPLFIVAHQDDELNYAGLIKRLGSKTHIIWVTNGDGLYFEMGVSPEKYAEIRQREAIKAAEAVGIDERNLLCLKFSEVEIYKRFAELNRSPQSMRIHKSFFKGIKDAIKDVVFGYEPDVIITDAWQGGHPEHDLTHFFAYCAKRDYEKEKKRPIDFIHIPEYEYTILIAMRFHPLYKGVRFRIYLTPEELEAKMRVIEAYPSQKRLFAKFERLFTYFGYIGRIIGGPKSAIEYISIEEFGPVPTIDYAKKPHIHDFFTYMFDDFEGDPVTFSGSVLPIIKEFL
ncbi:MAG: PIG-L family deacetylase [Deltaproteobacteria bacterium]|nr:PIG-L family deacetylase [Deltaproteobacteria bacterium]